MPNNSQKLLIKGLMIFFYENINALLDISHKKMKATTNIN